MTGLMGAPPHVACSQPALAVHLPGAGQGGLSRTELVILIGSRQMSMLRSYHPEHTGSHQNSEVKLDWAGLVLC